MSIINRPSAGPNTSAQSTFPAANRNTTSLSSRTVVTTESGDISKDWDFSSTPSSRARDLKWPVSASTLLAPALQAAYERGAASAATAVDQITADKTEVVSIIANFAVEPSEMLHLVDRWLLQLLGEFKQQRDMFKHRLREKWQNEELTNLTYDNNDKIRKMYSLYKDFETARNTLLSPKTFDELHNYLRKIDDSERDEMKEKFNSLAEDYSKILRALESFDRETKMNSGAGDNYISDVKKNLTKLKELNNKQSHTICIVGLEKAGKSTFINALLGYELVPTAAERCTQVRTVLRPPLEGGNQQIFAIVKFYNDDEFHVFYEKMIKKTDESQQQLDERKREVTATRDALRMKFPEEYFRITNWDDVERERKVICEQLYVYITGEVYCNIIKEISIYTDKLPGKNYELLDVPGFDSPIKEHRDAGLESIKIADAFVFLTNGQQPNLTQPQIRLLQEIHQNHFEAMQRAFGIITKLDLCSTPAIYQDHCSKAYNELIDKKFTPEHIYVACPRIQIIKKDSLEYNVISEKLQSFGSELVEGFELSKEGLNTFIEYELPKTHLKQLVELGQTRLLRSVEERLDQIKENKLLPQNLADKSIDQFIEQQKTESWDKIYNDNIFEPAFAKANFWHKTIVTKDRAQFINDVRQKFHDTFYQGSTQFLKSTHDIERLMLEKYGYATLQLDAHSIDDEVREELSFKLEKIVDETSDILAKHFYHQYICGLEKILNDVCPQLKDLYRPKLTLEKCLNETHALILRVCRPIITATLKYSYLDPVVKMNAINELIYIAPTVAYNIANTSDQSGSNGKVGMDIHKSVELLAENSEMTTLIIRTLFKR